MKVDQDSRPDISNRYEDFGWPATVIFNPNGGEIVKRQGYLPPRQMASILQAVIDDPSPGPSVEAEKPIAYATNTSFPAPLLAQINQEFAKQYDVEGKGWAFGHKVPRRGLRRVCEWRSRDAVTPCRSSACMRPCRPRPN